MNDLGVQLFMGAVLRDIVLFTTLVLENPEVCFTWRPSIFRFYF